MTRSTAVRVLLVGLLPRPIRARVRLKRFRHCRTVRKLVESIQRIAREEAATAIAGHVSAVKKAMVTIEAADEARRLDREEVERLVNGLKS